MAVCIYARVSTGEQELEQQILACRKYAEEKNLVVAYVFKEVRSGKDFLNREEFNKMMEQLRSGVYDGLIVFRLDRLGRSVREVLNIIHELNELKINIYSVHENFDTTTAVGRAMLNMILVLAQLERELISEATKQRLLAKKEAGQIYHRPKGAKDKKPRRKIGYFLRWERLKRAKK